MSEKPSTPSSEQSDKSKKYDRQLRLWGDHGQSALESSHVCLINASATGTETLKSLVLPGLGAITIVDDARITEQDLGNNFFIDHDSIGKYRGEVAVLNLLEMNPDVRGAFVDQSLEGILSDQPDFFKDFTLVVVTNVRESSLVTLSQLLWDLDIPLVHVRSYGLIGYVRVQVEEHTIIESHPDNSIPDLRLDRPFPKLINHVKSIDMNSMNHREYSHVPYAIILLKYLDEWREKHEGEMPKNYKEKKEFIQCLKGGMKSLHSKEETEENFEEAIRAVNTSVTVTSIPSNVLNIFEKAAAVNLMPSSKPFWILVKALQNFVQNDGGLLPISGIIPDMTADSDKYITLQTLYREQAASDADLVYKYVQEIAHQLGPRKSQISEEDVKIFCKNARFLNVVSGRSIADEYRGSVNLKDLGSQLDEPGSEMVWYVMLRAVDYFHSEFRAYPGFFKDQVESDIVRLKTCINKLMSDWGLSANVKDEYIHEMCRYGAAEIHSVSSFVGAIAAQEVIKVCTKQFVPIQTAIIYNAINSYVETIDV